MKRNKSGLQIAAREVPAPEATREYVVSVPGIKPFVLTGKRPASESGSAMLQSALSILAKV